MDMLSGLHFTLYSNNPQADENFFRNLLRLTHENVGGRLVFGLPPAQLAVLLNDGRSTQGLYLMVDDLWKFIEEMKGLNLTCTEPEEKGWAALSFLTLPGGGCMGLYEPRHLRPEPM